MSNRFIKFIEKKEKKRIIRKLPPTPCVERVDENRSSVGVVKYPTATVP